MRTRNVTEGQAYDLIREQAMNKRVTTEEIAGIVNANEILSLGNRPPAGTIRRSILARQQFAGVRHARVQAQFLQHAVDGGGSAVTTGRPRRSCVGWIEASEGICTQADSTTASTPRVSSLHMLGRRQRSCAPTFRLSGISSDRLSWTSMPSCSM